MKEIIKKIPFIYRFHRKISFLRAYLRNKPVLRQNSYYKDLYKGKRCFIIGNGPSLKKLDIKRLRNEYTFTVNSMSVTEEFQIIKPKFHIMVDSALFDLKNKVFIENLKKLLNLSDTPVCVFPIKARKNIGDLNPLTTSKNIYLMQGEELDNITNIDLAKPIPPYKNVVNVALYTALYMGFSEIILIGCDMTGFVKVYDETDNISYGGHFYDEKSVGDKEFLVKAHTERTNEFMLKSYGYAFELFRLTNDYAVKKGVKIINATQGGILDVFPRVKFTSLFTSNINNK